MSAPTLSQYAGVDALRNSEEDIAEMRDSYNQRRRYLVKRFKDLGIPCFEPFGAFYIFPNISQFGLTSEEFAMRLVEEERLAVVPGTAFGDSGGRLPTYLLRLLNRRLEDSVRSYRTLHYEVKNEK